MLSRWWTGKRSLERMLHSTEPSCHITSAEVIVVTTSTATLSPGLKSRVILFFFLLCFRFKFLIDKGMLFLRLVPLPLWEEVVELAEDVTELVSSVSSAASSSASCSAECSLSSPPSFSRKGGSCSLASCASSGPSSCISTGLADPSGVSSGLADPVSLLALAPPFLPGSSMEWCLEH